MVLVVDNDNDNDNDDRNDNIMKIRSNSSHPMTV